MEQVLLKLARQLRAFDEASLMALWDKYAEAVSRFEPSQRWEEAVLVLAMAERALTELSRSLAAALAGRTETWLEATLADCRDPDVPRRLDLLLAECQEALILNVNPALTLDRLATQAYQWLR